MLILTLGVERIAEWSSAWMHSNSNRLRLNSENRSFFGAQLADDVFNLTPWGQRQLNVCGSLIPPVTVVRDLGVMLQSDLSMKDHVARTANSIDCFKTGLKTYLFSKAVHPTSIAMKHALFSSQNTRRQ